MPDPAPDALEFLLTRRSRPAKTLSAPGPDRDALTPILHAALRSPDHKMLEPWRLVVLSPAAMQRLSRLVGERGTALGRAPAEIEKQQATYQTSPGAIAVIGIPQVSDAVPPVEQVLSTGAVCAALLNAALAAGWGANWLSGWPSHDPVFVREAFGCEGDEWCAGLIHIGTETVAPPDRPRPDPDRKVAWLDN